MQFVNIIVHSVEDMNFRVHLQYEFTALGLDGYLERLRLTESEELQVQISAYLDNVFDVAALMEDSETKTAALEKVAELEDELGQVVRYAFTSSITSLLNRLFILQYSILICHFFFVFTEKEKKDKTLYMPYLAICKAQSVNRFPSNVN